MEREKIRPRAASIDGYGWSAEREAELNELAVATFSSGPGKEFLDYLKQITSPAFGPQATDAELRHAAGQRFLVGLIDTRMVRGIAARKGDGK